MTKEKRLYLILSLVIIFSVCTSYLLFSNGFTNKLKGVIQNSNEFKDDVKTADSYPIITNVFNSSGEKKTSNDVAITYMAESRYKITNVLYSFDMKKWKNLGNVKFDGKKATAKLVFSKTMNEKVYVVFENERGFRSYAYRTLVNIDKEKPVITILDKIYYNDNDNVKYVQYSNDLNKWKSFTINNKFGSVVKNKNYKYVRLVDNVGNISKVLEIR